MILDFGIDTISNDDIIMKIDFKIVKDWLVLQSPTKTVSV